MILVKYKNTVGLIQLIVLCHTAIVYVNLRHLTSGYEANICAINFMRKLTNHQRAPTGPSQTCCGCTPMARILHNRRENLVFRQ